MRLLDLDPRWLVKDDARIGFVFRNPVRGQWWVSCFFAPTPSDTQEALIEAALGPDANYQACNPAAGWQVVSGSIAEQSFETISVTPSLDGGPHFWHGHITAGAIVGGLPS